MSKPLEDELKELRERNTVLAQKVQYWRVTAHKKETEKIELLRENNHLRMKLNKHRNAGSAMDKYLQASVQELSEKSLTGLVEVSTGIAKVIEVIKSHMAKKRDIETVELSPTPRKSSSNVRKVIPMIRGHAQPSLVLSRLSDALHNSYVNGVAENQVNDNRISGDVPNEAREDPVVSGGDPGRSSQAVREDGYSMQNVFVILDRLNMEQLNNATTGSESDGEFSPVSSSEGEAVEEEDVEGGEEERGEEPYSVSHSDNLDVVEEEVEREAEEEAGEEGGRPALRDLEEQEEARGEEGSSPLRNSEEEEDAGGGEGRTTLRDLAVVLQRLSPQALPEHSSPRVAVLTSQAAENPMEGPSWMLDGAAKDTPYHDSPTFFSVKNQQSRSHRTKAKEPLQAPDSTTEGAGGSRAAAGGIGEAAGEEAAGGKRSQSRHGHKRKLARVTFQSDSDSDEEDNYRPNKRRFVRQQKGVEKTKDPTSVRVLISKMNMEALPRSPLSPAFRVRGGGAEGVATPTRNLFMETETPSPNGSVPHLYISDNSLTSDRGASDEECERRRPRRVVPKNYKEKPLNRKLRRG